MCARVLAQAGWPVVLVTPRAADEIASHPALEEAQRTRDAIATENLPITVLINPDLDTLADELEEARAIVDAVLGTGFNGDTVREPAASWIEAANARRSATTRCKGKHAQARRNKRRTQGAPFAIAVDVPSGLSAQTGTAALPCFHADETVTMLAFKPGLLARASKPYTGWVELAELVEEQAD